jgi:hypothetical protein
MSKFIDEIEILKNIKIKDIKKKRMKIINDIPIYGGIKIKDIKRKKMSIINDIPLLADIKIKHLKKLKSDDFRLANILQVKYVYIFFLVLLFFIYGLILSELIDFFFPHHDETKEDHYIILEIAGEIGVVYIIYFLLKRYINYFIDILFNKLHASRPFYLSELLLVSFSYGIYRKLTKYNDKSEYLKNKYINILDNIKNTVFHKTKIYYKKNIHSKIFPENNSSSEEE